jgi:outer membrane protein assembly factor BamB
MPQPVTPDFMNMLLEIPSNPGRSAGTRFFKSRRPGRYGRVAALLASVPGLIGLPAIGREWPEFRGPTGQGIATAKNVPVHWSATSNVVWKTPVPGEGWSSPVIADGKIYLTAAVLPTGGGGPLLQAACVNLGSGRIEWQVTALEAGAGDAAEFHKKNSHASPTPIVHQGRLYVHFGHMGTAALDLTGRVLWRQTTLKYPPLHGNGGSPALIGDQLIFSCDGSKDPFVVALDAATGQVRWRTPRTIASERSFSFSTPLVIEADGVSQVVSPASGFVASYDVKDGRELWRSGYGDGFSVIVRPTFAHGLIYVSSSFTRPVLYAIRVAGARGDVTDSHLAWKHTKGVPNTASPVVVGDEIYFVSDSGIATCLDARTGKEHWSERLGGDFSASPVWADGRLYFQNEAGVGYVVAEGRQFRLLAKNELEERTLASPAVLDGTLILRSQGHLWRIGK